MLNGCLQVGYASHNNWPNVSRAISGYLITGCAEESRPMSSAKDRTRFILALLVRVYNLQTSLPKINFHGLVEKENASERQQQADKECRKCDQSKNVLIKTFTFLGHSLVQNGPSLMVKHVFYCIDMERT